MSTPNSPLEVSVERSDGVTTLFLSGELFHDVVPVLQEKTETVLADPDLTGVCFDLSRIGFVDSAGLRVILDAHLRTKERGAECIIRNPSPTTQRLLELTGLVDHIPVENNWNHKMMTDE